MEFPLGRRRLLLGEQQARRGSYLGAIEINKLLIGADRFVEVLSGHEE